MTIPDAAWGERKNTKTLKQNCVQATNKQAAPKGYDLMPSNKSHIQFQIVSYVIRKKNSLPSLFIPTNKYDKSEDESRASTTADTCDEFRGKNFTFRRSSGQQVMPNFPPQLSRDYKPYKKLHRVSSCLQVHHVSLQHATQSDIFTSIINHYIQFRPLREN